MTICSTRDMNCVQNDINECLVTHYLLLKCHKVKTIRYNITNLEVLIWLVIQPAHCFHEKCMRTCWD